MALAASQKITRVLPGRPFGDGSSGDLTISSSTTQSLTLKSCSGTSGTTTLTISSGDFSNNDVVLIYQVRGTGVGAWEINMVASGGGTTSLTMSQNLANTYTDSGASQAQVIKLSRYRNITLDSTFTLSGTDWTGDIGGLLVFVCNGTLTINGTGEINGGNGANCGTGTGDGAAGTGGGFYGGKGVQSQNPGFYGEGSTGASAASSSGAANGNGGGAGDANGGSNNGGAGGGGGHVGNGGNGVLAAAGNYAGTGGGTVGAAELTTMIYGGGGGGAGNGANENYGAGGGGSGGGGIFIIAKNIVVHGSTGSLTANGGEGSNGYRAGGGGAGGFVLIQCQTATLNTNRITALFGLGGASVGNTGTGDTSVLTAGGSGDDSSEGGNGNNGRIAIHHSSTVTGTTNPTFNDTTDGSLVETLGGIVMFALT